MQEDAYLDGCWIENNREQTRLKKVALFFHSSIFSTKLPLYHWEMMHRMHQSRQHTWDLPPLLILRGRCFATHISKQHSKLYRGQAIERVMLICRSNNRSLDVPLTRQKAAVLGPWGARSQTTGCSSALRRVPTNLQFDPPKLTPLASRFSNWLRHSSMSGLRKNLHKWFIQVRGTHYPH